MKVKLENSEKIKKFNELGIAQIPYEKKFVFFELTTSLALTDNLPASANHCSVRWDLEGHE